MLTSIQQFQLGDEATFRQRVLMLSRRIAAEVAAEDPATLPGELTEHNARFSLAQTANNSSSINDNRVRSAALSIAVSLRDDLTWNDDVLALIDDIEDDTILTVMRQYWSFTAGFNVRAYQAEQAQAGV